MRNIGSAVLMVGVLLVILNTALLINSARQMPNADEWAIRMVRRLKGDTGISVEIIVTSALLGIGIVLTMVGLGVTVRQRPSSLNTFGVPGEYFGKKMVGFTIMRIVASALLVWALAKHPYGYYTLLRFVVCCTASYGTFIAVRSKKVAWAWILGVVAVLFNPILPVHLERSTWAVIDVLVAKLLMFSVFIFRSVELTANEKEEDSKSPRDA